MEFFDHDRPLKAAAAQCQGPTRGLSG